MPGDQTYKKTEISEEPGHPCCSAAAAVSCACRSPQLLCRHSKATGERISVHATGARAFCHPCLRAGCVENRHANCRNRRRHDTSKLLILANKPFPSQPGRARRKKSHLGSCLDIRDRATGGVFRNYTHRKPSSSKIFYCRGFSRAKPAEAKPRTSFFLPGFRWV